MANKPTYEELEKRVLEFEKSEKEYRFLAENMADMVWTVDLDFQTTYVSPSIEKMLGLTPEERKRQSLAEMITPESAQRAQQVLGEEIQREQEVSTDPDRSVTIEIEYYRKDGSTVWMENCARFIRDGNGVIIGMLGASRDITERKWAEESLRESHKTLSVNSGKYFKCSMDNGYELS